jgi:hypothetical protein
MTSDPAVVVIGYGGDPSAGDGRCTLRTRADVEATWYEAAMRFDVLLVPLALALGCGDDASPATDAGRLDTATPERDSGTAADAGGEPGDAGTGEDAARADAGLLGACCNIAGLCMDLGRAECMAVPRFHSWNMGTDCTSHTCPDERQGACCTEEGECMNGTTVDLCGPDRHAGEGTTCDEVDCTAL